MKKIYLLTCIIAASAVFSIESDAKPSFLDNLKAKANSAIAGATELAKKGQAAAGDLTKKAQEISKKAAPALEKAKDLGAKALPMVAKVTGKSESEATAAPTTEETKDQAIDTSAETAPTVVPEAEAPSVPTEIAPKVDPAASATTAQTETTTQSEDPSIDKAAPEVIPETTSENLLDTTGLPSESPYAAAPSADPALSPIDPTIKAKIDPIFANASELINASKAGLEDNDIPYFIEQLSGGADAGVEGLTLNLAGNKITTQGVAALLDGIKKYPKLIAIIDLSGNPLGDDVTNILFGKDVLPTAKSILMANTNLTGSGVLDILKLIIDSNNAVLEYLDLSGNKTTDDYLQLIFESAKTLKDKGTLKEIDLTGNQITNVPEGLIIPEILTIKSSADQVF